MNGWVLVAVPAVLAFGAGYVIRSWVCLIRCQDTQHRLARAICAHQVYIDHLENARDRADTHGGEVVAEAERITEHGS